MFRTNGNREFELREKVIELILVDHTNFQQPL